MRRLFLSLLLIAVACGSDTKTTEPSTPKIDGVWDLKTINGQVLPYSFPPSQGVAVAITSSVLTITGNGSGTYNEVVSYRATSGASAINGSDTELGTWLANGGSISFTVAGQTRVTYQGSVTGSTLTEIVDGYTQVYQRR